MVKGLDASGLMLQADFPKYDFQNVLEANDANLALITSKHDREALARRLPAAETTANDQVVPAKS